ncbi:glycosyl transferase [Pedobacter frigidisoli]|uniref:Glycosyl transferase n=1 Tax=Pedobacter frigidisoli TaxID=2530455 RepID=A0A4R0P5L4_9SPHI|nr:glycosyl transferase [Pedobacter frigidisoli]TCD07723.1 glycosyl transferase [Pedobacter frigidisoli]
MEYCSINIEPLKSFDDGLPVYFLTGKKHLYQTLFCIQSLTRISDQRFRFILVDDGSFNKTILRRIGRQIPDAEIITKEIIEKNLEEQLPKKDFASIHHKRKVYPHIKKLVDIHLLGITDWKLVLDSDMLFWKEPTAIVEWLKDPKVPLYMKDCEESYGYSTDLMQSLTLRSIPSLINVGVIGLNSQAINWSSIEEWIKVLEGEEGTSYYLEQALTAMIISESEKFTMLNALEYIVNPSKKMVEDRQGILHHYVDLSKESYFKYAWKNL